MATDLKAISIEELEKEIKSRDTVEPLFVRDGKNYYDVKSYDKKLAYFDKYGRPEDYTPIEFNQDGTAKYAEPQDVVINLEAFLSNRVWVDTNATNSAYHVVIDTRSVREADSGNLTLAFIPEYIVTKDGRSKGGVKIEKSTVSREDYLKKYTQALDIPSMLKVMKQIADDVNLQTSDAGKLSLEF